MRHPQVQKSALAPASADVALEGTSASLRVIDVAVDAAEFPEHANPHLKVALVLEAKALEVSWQSATGRAMQGKVARGTVSVMPQQMHYTTRWHGDGRMLLLSFAPAFLRTIDADFCKVAGSLRPAWAQADPLLTQLGLSVLAAQQAGLATTTYLDSAAEVAMVHLQSRYGSVAVPSPPLLLQGRLSRVVDLIEAHLGEDLPLSRLAEVTGLSVYGFARAFAKGLGMPPHRYVLKRRIVHARHLLARTATPIAEIAMRLGFSSQAHLTTAFLRETGSTPASYRARSLAV